MLPVFDFRTRKLIFAVAYFHAGPRLGRLRSAHCFDRADYPARLVSVMVSGHRRAEQAGGLSDFAGLDVLDCSSMPTYRSPIVCLN
jgi:hypothetical protein